MAIPTFFGAGAVTSGAGAISPGWATGHQANDIGIMIVTTAVGQAINTIPSGWSQEPNSPQDAASGVRLTVLWKRAASSSESALSIGDSGTFNRGVILVFRGCDTASDPNAATSGDGSAYAASSSISIPGLTTPVNDCLIVSICATQTIGSSSSAYFSGWANSSLASVTEILDSNNFQYGGYGVCTGGKASSGSVSATTATYITTTAQAHMMIALKPPASNSDNFFLLLNSMV